MYTNVLINIKINTFYCLNTDHNMTKALKLPAFPDNLVHNNRAMRC